MALVYFRKQQVPKQDINFATAFCIGLSSSFPESAIIIHLFVLKVQLLHCKYINGAEKSIEVNMCTKSQNDDPLAAAVWRIFISVMCIDCQWMTDPNHPNNSCLLGVSHRCFENFTSVDPEWLAVVCIGIAYHESVQQSLALVTFEIDYLGVC